MDATIASAGRQSMKSKGNAAAAKLGIGIGSFDDNDEKSIMGNEETGFGMSDMDTSDKKPATILPKKTLAQKLEPKKAPKKAATV